MSSNWTLKKGPPLATEQLSELKASLQSLPPSGHENEQMPRCPLARRAHYFYTQGSTRFLRRVSLPQTSWSPVLQRREHSLLPPRSCRSLRASFQRPCEGLETGQRLYSEHVKMSHPVGSTSRYHPAQFLRGMLQNTSPTPHAAAPRKAVYKMKVNRNEKLPRIQGMQRSDSVCGRPGIMALLLSGLLRCPIL